MIAMKMIISCNHCRNLIGSGLVYMEDNLNIWFHYSYQIRWWYFRIVFCICIYWYNDQRWQHVYNHLQNGSDDRFKIINKNVSREEMVCRLPLTLVIIDDLEYQNMTVDRDTDTEEALLGRRRHWLLQISCERTPLSGVSRATSPGISSWNIFLFLLS